MSPDSALLRLPPDQQELADVVVRASSGTSRFDRHPAFDQLTSWLEQEDRLYRCILDPLNRIHAPTLRHLVKHAWDRFNGQEQHDAIRSAVREAAKLALAGEPDFWGDEPAFQVAAMVAASWGETKTLGFIFEHTAEPLEWEGVFQDRAGYCEWIERRGLIASMKRFDAIPINEILELWGAQYRQGQSGHSEEDD